METKRTEPGDPDRARPKLLDRVRDEIRRLHYSSRTERASCTTESGTPIRWERRKSPHSSRTSRRRGT
jgi:hypothetical protein